MRAAIIFKGIEKEVGTPIDSINVNPTSVEMDHLRFNEGEADEQILGNLQLNALVDVCRSLPSYTPSKGRTRKDIYRFIGSLEDKCRRGVFDEIQKLLANPTTQTCKRSWMLKRKQEDTEAEIRRVRARLEDINSNMRSFGGSANDKVEALALTDRNDQARSCQQTDL
jgi:hypothetical protein